MKKHIIKAGGALVAIGTIMTQIEDPDWVKPVGAGLVALGAALLGTGRHNKVTSEEANAKHQK